MRQIKLINVVGARPQFIKAAAVSRAIAAFNEDHDDVCIEERIVHTGQHYDENMSKVFFEQLELPAADINLGIAGGTHAAMTAAMLEGIEAELMARRVDWVLVYGDTNSTLAAALAAAKLHIPVAHVEAGLRSFNRRMPEEINRVLADHVSALLLCPTQVAVDNLRAEGITQGVELVGDVMYDASLHYGPLAGARSLLGELGLAPGAYYLATCHREENTDDPDCLAAIFEGLARLGREAPVLLPLHPRTRKRLAEHGLKPDGSIRLLPPVGYLEMMDLGRSARAILTDSGGVQKEAYWFAVDQPATMLAMGMGTGKSKVESSWNVSRSA